ncbi:MAG: dienelactone hydrolase [Rhodothermales bacterium]|jgi:dienelactone hydrolase
MPRDPLIWDAEIDGAAALEYLRSHPRIDATAIGVVGESYSGEEAAEVARSRAFAQVLVVLSPGSLSEASISAIDSTGIPWLFVTAREDPFLVDITATVSHSSGNAELSLLPGEGHATNLFSEHRDLAEKIAVWLAARLR